VNKTNGAVDIVSENISNFTHGTKTKANVYEKSFRQSSQLLMLAVSGNMSSSFVHLPGHKAIFFIHYNFHFTIIMYLDIHHPVYNRYVHFYSVDTILPYPVRSLRLFHTSKCLSQNISQGLQSVLPLSFIALGTPTNSEKQRQCFITTEAFSFRVR
jgi:hypothetical protein